MRVELDPEFTEPAPLKVVTAAKFRSSTSDAYNEVMKNEGVLIKHRNRPSMALISLERYEVIRECEHLLNSEIVE